MGPVAKKGKKDSVENSNKYSLRSRAPKEVKTEEVKYDNTSKKRKNESPSDDDEDCSSVGSDFSDNDSGEEFYVEAEDRSKSRNRSRPACRSSSSSSVGSENSTYEILERPTKTTLADLGGLAILKKTILGQVIRPFACPQQARQLKLKAPRGLLLSGRPGTGKTAMADAIVSEIRALGRNVKYYAETGTCLSKYLGETEQRLRDVFRLAHENSPAVIFLDELDGLGKSRSGCASVMTTVVTTLLTELSAVKHGEVLLIAATNHKQAVDSALIRKGRFDLHYELPVPDLAGRREILRMYQAKCDQEMDDDDFEELATRTENFSGSDLEVLVHTIHANVVDRMFPNGAWCGLTAKEVKRRMKASGESMQVQMDTDVDPLLDTFLVEVVNEQVENRDVVEIQD